MYRNLQDPQSPRESSLKLELDGKKSSEVDRWGEAGSPTEPTPHKDLHHQLSFIPTSGRLLKSESEDSGVEMASSDHSPSTPVDSEKSFTLDCVDGFQPSASTTVASHDSSANAEQQVEPDPSQDRPYHRNLSVSKKLAQVVQRSQKHRLPSRSSRQLGQRSRSHLDLEGLKAYCAPSPVSVDDVVGTACGENCRANSGCNTPLEQHTEAMTSPSKQKRRKNDSCTGLLVKKTFIHLHFTVKLYADELQAEEPSVGNLYGESAAAHKMVAANCEPDKSSAQQVQNEPSLTMPGQGLQYLEHICQMLEKIAQLQRANQQLQYQHKLMECRLRAQEPENDGLSEETPEESRLTGAEPLPGSQAATEMEESPNSRSPYYPHHFRARSASDTHVVLSPAHHLENRPESSEKATAHFSSSPSLIDQPDGGSCTLPPGMKLKNEHSHWGKVKVLINRIKRKSVRANEQTPFGEAAPSSRWSRVDDVPGKQELHPRRRFLPSLGAKKYQSKHFPMR